MDSTYSRMATDSPNTTRHVSYRVHGSSSNSFIEVLKHWTLNKGRVAVCLARSKPSLDLGMTIYAAQLARIRYKVKLYKSEKKDRDAEF